MNLHQVLTGAVNPGDHCFSVGSVGDQRFTVSAGGAGPGRCGRGVGPAAVPGGLCCGSGWAGAGWGSSPPRSRGGWD